MICGDSNHNVSRSNKVELVADDQLFCAWYLLMTNFHSSSLPLLLSPTLVRRSFFDALSGGASSGFLSSKIFDIIGKIE